MALSANASSSTRTTTIDSLSICVIVHILSFLPIADAIKSSLVRKEWRNLWHQIPTLNLDIVPFHSPLNSYERTRELFNEFIDQVLRIRPPGPLHKLYIRYDCGWWDDSEKLTSWIKYAINCEVKELDVDCDTCDLNCIIETEVGDNGEVRTTYELDDYVDHHFDFSCLINKSVEVLKFNLGCCDSPLLPSTIQPTDFASLRSMTVDNVSFQYEGCDEEFASLVQNCVNLEHLIISDCWGLRRIMISSSKLKICKITGDSTEEKPTSLVITAAFLHSLSLWYVLVENNLLEGCPNLIKVDLSLPLDRRLTCYGWWCAMLRSLTWVKCLIVQNMFFAQRHLGHEETVLPSFKFKHLSHLNLLTGYDEIGVEGICLFLQDAPELKTLVIDYCYYPKNGEEGTIRDELMNDEVTIHLPRLEEVKMKNYRGTKGELLIVKLLKVHAEVLEKVVAFPVRTGEDFPKPFTLWAASNDEVVISGQKRLREI